MANIMIDIETYSSEINAQIVQVGAIKFDLGKGNLSDPFIYNVAICDDNIKRHKSFATMEWWREQSQEAREGLRIPPPIPLRLVLTALANYVSSDDAVWANSPSFDLAILRNAYVQLGMKVPWHYRGERDCRTLWKVVPKQGEEWIKGEIDLRTGGKLVEHNGLDDAKEQALSIHLSYKWIKENIW